MYSGRTLCIFIDESSQTKHKYLGLGALVLDEEDLPSFTLGLHHAKNLELRGGELKWSKVSSAKLAPYKLYVDRFFDFNSRCVPLHFHSLFVDTAKRRDFEFNDGDRDKGFSKEVYQLLLKCVRLYPNAVFKVFADHRETKFDCDFLYEVANNGARKKTSRPGTIFKSVVFVDSKRTECIQMVDVLLGSISFRLNAHDRSKSPSASKIHLSEYILGRASVRDVSRGTLPAGKFTIWHRVMRSPDR